MNMLLDREFTSAKEIKLYNEFGQEVNGYKAIVNANDDRSIFTIATNAYQITQHKDVVETVVSALESTGVKYTPLRVTDVNGRMYVEFDLPTIQHDVKSVGDIVNLRVGVYNSYDASMGVRVETYGHRLICSNGCWASEAFNRYYSRHVRGIELETIREGIVSGIAAFKDKLCVMFEKYAQEQVSENSVVAFIDDCRENKVIPIKYLDAIETNVIHRTGADVEPVTNKWMLYNSITEILTHDTSDIFTQRRAIRRMDKVLAEYKFAA